MYNRYDYTRPAPKRNGAYISSSIVRLQSESGEQLGVVPTGKARAMAEDAGLDLIEISASADPPVYRIGDRNKWEYAQKKAKKEQDKKNRAAAAASEEKEIQLSPNIGKADFDTKLRKANEFLSDGHRVRFSVRFRGREVTHAGEVMPRLTAEIAASAVAGTQLGNPVQFDRNWNIIYIPKK